MAACDCHIHEHEVVASEDVFLCIPEDCNQYYHPIYCVSSNGCERMSCTASQPGYAAHCCKVCADTNGLQHSAACDEHWAWMSKRLYVKKAN